MRARLELLTGGARDLPAHQQTLRHTLDWSYELLDERAKTLFQHLAVFEGGWTLEAAEATCTTDKADKSDKSDKSGHAPSADVLEAMQALQDMSLGAAPRPAPG